MGTAWARHGHGMGIGRDPGGRFGQKPAHGSRGDGGQHKRPLGAGGGLPGGQEGGKRKALAAKPWRALAAAPPAMGGCSLLACSRLVFEPQLDAAAWMRRRCAAAAWLRAWAAPLCLNASCASGSACGWPGRVFCLDRPSRLSTRDRLAGCSRLPQRCAISSARAGRVHCVRPWRARPRTGKPDLLERHALRFVQNRPAATLGPVVLGRVCTPANPSTS